MAHEKAALVLFPVTSSSTDITIQQAQELLEQGLPYVDVRTEEEFAAGHVPGALNLPYRLAGPGGLVENPLFLPLFTRLFSPEQKVILGCKSGARSAQACTLLQQQGYTQLLNLKTGFEGSRDPFGRPLPGWKSAGLPVEQEAEAQQTYAALLQAHPLSS